MHIRFPTRPHNAENDFIKSQRQRDNRQGDRCLKTNPVDCNDVKEATMQNRLHLRLQSNQIDCHNVTETTMQKQMIRCQRGNLAKNF